MHRFTDCDVTDLLEDVRHADGCKELRMSAISNEESNQRASFASQNNLRLVLVVLDDFRAATLDKCATLVAHGHHHTWVALAQRVQLGKLSRAQTQLNLQ